ncbi:serine/threonine protein kinase [Teredinibacter purpureus]|uniref:serine/threonine protein kinase n=1 Tax=Teredinibacter purpureus TaxID=2731756 RepID=UPI0009E63A40|nr:serine/threonine protein kinase [Teredinibacter purpureus]
MTQTPFENLNPDKVIDAIESHGYLSDLRVFPLNSYENRVYQFGVEEGEPIIAKFYRPQRWSDEQIQEEHAFSLELAEMEIPIVAPIKNDKGISLFHFDEHRFSLYPRRGGHAPDLGDLETLYRLGQQLGRLHAIGKIKPFKYRPTLDLQSYAINSRDFLMSNDFIPQTLTEAYSTLSQHLIDRMQQVFSETPYETFRIHGDCHPGNILLRPESLWIVDLDDARNGPAIQDIWMLLSGDYPQKCQQLAEVIEGYEEFCEFDRREIPLIETLRTLRLMHYAAWLARRWSDPAFPQAFPWFNSERYWSEHILELREQMSALDEPSLRLSDV